MNFIISQNMKTQINKMRLFLLISITLMMVSSQEKVKTKQSWLPKILWTWWEKQIPDNDYTLQLFDFNHKLYAKGWQVRHLDDRNLQYWLKQVPDYNNVLHTDFFQNTKPPRKSDLVRLLVVKHFGGLYLDYTMMLSQSLDWIVDIANQQLVENKFGQIPDVLLLHNTNHGSKQYVIDSEGNKVLYRPTYESFYVAAKPNAQFIQLWYQKFVWARSQSFKIWGNDYMKSVISQVVSKNNISTFGFYNPYFQQSICGQVVLQLKQQQLDREWEKDKSKPRQFAVKYFKIWSVNTKDTAYAHQQIPGFNSDKGMQIYCQKSIQENKKSKLYSKYFLKFDSYFRGYGLQRFWLNEASIKQATCPIKNYILEDSLCYQFALKDYPIKFYSNPVVKKVQDMDCDKIKGFKFEISKKQLQSLKMDMDEENKKAQQIEVMINKLQEKIQSVNKKININVQKSQDLQHTQQIQLLKKQFKDKLKEKQTIMDQLKQKVKKMEIQLSEFQDTDKKLTQNHKSQLQNLKKQSNLSAQYLQKNNVKIKQLQQSIKNMKKQLIKQNQDKQFYQKYNKQIKSLQQALFAQLKQKQKNKAQLEQIQHKMIQIKENNQNYHLIQKENNENTNTGNSQLKIVNDIKDLIYLSIICALLLANFIAILCFRAKHKNKSQTYSQPSLNRTQIFEEATNSLAQQQNFKG